MDFSNALSAAKQGKKISREGWNGKGMYVRREDGDPRECRPPYLILNAADGKVYPWVASQADLFAEDWTTD